MADGPTSTAALAAAAWVARANTVADLGVSRLITARRGPPTAALVGVKPDEGRSQIP